MEILFIFILIIELSLIGFYIYQFISKRKIFSKTNFIYVVPIYLVLLTHYIAAEINLDSNLSFFDLISCLLTSLKSFSGDVNHDTMNLLLDKSTLIESTFYIAVILAMYTIISSLSSLVSFRITNWYRVKKALLKPVDIVLGNDEDSKTYFKNSPNAIIWIEKRLTSVEQQDLFVNKTPYINRIFDAKNLKNYLSKEREVHLIAIDKEVSTKIKQLNVFIDSMESVDDSIIFQTHLHLELNQDNYLSLRKSISSNNQMKLNIHCFNRYNLMARDFVLNHPMTEFLTEKEIDYQKALLKENTSINCCFLGFGKVNEELLKVSIINNQFVSLDQDKRLKPALVNYVAFDNNEAKRTNKNLINIKRELQDYDSEKYFEKGYKTHNFSFCHADINEELFYQKLNEVIKKEQKSFTYYIVSIGTDFDNLDLARKVLDSIYENQVEHSFHIFVRIVNKGILEAKLLHHPNVSYFGDLASILTHDIIVSNRLNSLAMNRNYLYNKKRVKRGVKTQQDLKDKNDWRHLPYIKQLSNEFSILDIRFKLQLLNLDYRPKDNNGAFLDEKEFLNIYLKDKPEAHKNGCFVYDLEHIYHRREDDFVLRDVLAYQEHLRWCALYRLNGYLPLSKDKIDINQNFKITNQDNELRLHACLTTFEGLNEYHHYLVDCYLRKYQSDKSYQELLKKIDTYQYDYQVMDQVYDLLKSVGLGIYIRSK